jgi:hypothetical protein
MYRIAITGKARSGKDTTAKLLVQTIRKLDAPLKYSAKYMAFADPIKKIACQMFPDIPRQWLYGSSELRGNIIPGAFKGAIPLTVRQLLIDIGNEFGRQYDPKMWINHFKHAYDQACLKGTDIIMVKDVRRRNEFDFLKTQNFIQVRVLRDDCTKIDDISETDQDGIQNSEFSFVIDNNKDKKYLKQQVEHIAKLLTDGG